MRYESVGTTNKGDEKVDLVSKAHRGLGSRHILETFPYLSPRLQILLRRLDL